jgi:hypothetical protein
MTFDCFVCHQLITSEHQKGWWVEGVTHQKTRIWVWGPVLVHYDCRMELKTPIDPIALSPYQATSSQVSLVQAQSLEELIKEIVNCYEVAKEVNSRKLL